jgi:flagella basal body P-ring formation protein FlgA
MRTSLQVRMQTLFAAVLTIAAATPAHAIEPWLDAAEQALVTALQKAYPQVVSWDVQPLLGRMQLAHLGRLTPAEVQPVVLGARSAVRISWATQSAARKRATVWFSVSGMQSVLAARSHIRAGSIVGPPAAVQSESDVLSLGCRPLTSAADLTDMRAMRSFAENATLCADGFERRPAVARGETVLVRSGSGVVTVLTKGTALQDGALGQILKVRNPASRGTYLAAVTGTQEVTVHE